MTSSSRLGISSSKTIKEYLEGAYCIDGVAESALSEDEVWGFRQESLDLQQLCRCCLFLPSGILQTCPSSVALYPCFQSHFASTAGTALGLERTFATRKSRSRMPSILTKMGSRDIGREPFVCPRQTFLAALSIASDRLVVPIVVLALVLVTAKCVVVPLE